jgi:GalNAc-alpha-(1->4)-GalNAc-alpha-(1->3)-diNAcBac-PP-undecaprenol alpha-1,4-N-acetyl-D-galactosaminyltransferase
MRMLLVISGLGSGGAERVLVSLANAWSSRGDDITILTWDSSPAFYSIDASVRRVSVGLAANSSGVVDGVCSNRLRVRALRRCVRQLAPDVVISFMDRTNVLSICATFGLGTPTIVCEHNDPAQLRIGAIWSGLRLLIYPMASVVTFLTTNVVMRWRPLLGSKAVPMPNPVVVDEQDGGSDERLFKHPYNLIAIGRLVPQKGFDLLLKAFRHVAPRYEQWGLTILGEGDLRPNLERMIETFGLGGRVHLAGKVTPPS